MDKEADTFTLTERKNQDLPPLLDLPPTECHIYQKDLECLIVNIHSIYLTVTQEVSHLYNIQSSLTQGGEDRSCMFLIFHQELLNWRELVYQTVAHTSHLDEIVCQEPNHLGFWNNSNIGMGGVYLDPAKSGTIIVWRHH